MRIVHQRIPAVMGAAIIAALLFVGCGLTDASNISEPVAPTTVIPNTVTITQGEQFSPYILEVSPGTTVTWHNNDLLPHTMQTSPLTSAFLNPVPLSLQAAAQGATTFTFTQPGLYDYFDPHFATWNTKDQRVQAASQFPSYPEAMEGVIWVKGAVAGLPKQATDSIPNLKDDFVKEFMAVQTGGAVTWHNYDTDKHYVTPVTGWQGDINPDPSFQLHTINGTTAQPPTGGTITVTFTKPGLYYYYCSAHADVDSIWNRAKAHDNASEYPIPMEGFVLVAPSS